MKKIIIGFFVGKQYVEIELYMNMRIRQVQCCKCDNIKSEFEKIAEQHQTHHQQLKQHGNEVNIDVSESNSNRLKIGLSNFVFDEDKMKISEREVVNSLKERLSSNAMIPQSIIEPVVNAIISYRSKQLSLFKDQYKGECKCYTTNQNDKNGEKEIKKYGDDDIEELIDDHIKSKKSDLQHNVSENSDMSMDESELNISTKSTASGIVSQNESAKESKSSDRIPNLSELSESDQYLLLKSISNMYHAITENYKLLIKRRNAAKSDLEMVQKAELEHIKTLEDESLSNELLRSHREARKKFYNYWREELRTYQLEQRTVFIAFAKAEIQRIQSMEKKSIKIQDSLSSPSTTNHFGEIVDKNKKPLIVQYTYQESDILREGLAGALVDSSLGDSSMSSYNQQGSKSEIRKMQEKGPLNMVTDTGVFFQSAFTTVGQIIAGPLVGKLPQSLNLIGLGNDKSNEYQAATCVSSAKLDIVMGSQCKVPLEIQIQLVSHFGLDFLDPNQKFGLDDSFDNTANSSIAGNSRDKKGDAEANARIKSKIRDMRISLTSVNIDDFRGKKRIMALPMAFDSDTPQPNPYLVRLCETNPEILLSKDVYQQFQDAQDLLPKGENNIDIHKYYFVTSHTNLQGVSNIIHVPHSYTLDMEKWNDMMQRVIISANSVNGIDRLLIPLDLWISPIASNIADGKVDTEPKGRVPLPTKKVTSFLKSLKNAIGSLVHEKGSNCNLKAVTIVITGSSSDAKIDNGVTEKLKGIVHQVFFN